MRQQAIRACDVEPIHTPGRVQAHGVLFALDNDGRVVAASDNCAAFTGCLPQQTLGQHITAILMEEPGSLPPAARTFGMRPQLREVLVEWGRVVPKGGGGPVLEVLAHRNSQDLWIVEGELAVGEGLHFATHERQFHRQIQRAQQRLHDAPALQELIERTVQEIFACFGFDRVMAYRFDALWNGTVLAEARAPGLGSYMNQKFPASDIPTQARLTFMKNWLRCIPDVRFLPSPLIVGKDGPVLESLDMMLCHLRSPSPVHIEYLVNMGVRATMTVSLLSEGRLWGLIACHHMTPAQLPHEKRQAAEMIGRTASALLASKEANENSDYRRQIEAVQSKLFDSMNRDDDLIPGLVKAYPNVLDLVSGASSSAAIFFEGRWSFLGPVPPVSELNGLVQWLVRNKPGVEVWHTEMLIAEYPVSEAFCQVASGVLAMNMPKSDNTFVLWFRPEVPRVIEWAGVPEKNVQMDEDGPHLHPRKSFEGWQEVVKCRSLPWRPVEIEAAALLRKSMIELDLKRQFRREQVARAAVEVEKQRFRFLSDATGLLGQSLDYEKTLGEFAESLVHSFCDWVCIYVDGERGLHRAIIAHATPQGRTIAEELHNHEAIYKQLEAQTKAVFDKGEALYVPRTDTWLHQHLPSPYTNFLIQRLGFESMMLLPIVARDKVLGVIKCVRSDKARRFMPDDFRLGLQFSQRAASCVDNALLYRSSQQAIQARDHVMGVVSHDLRNPLGAIRLTAEMITRKYDKQRDGEMPPLIARGMQQIESACRRMNGLIEDVLSLSKIEAGRFTVDMLPVAVKTLLDEAIGLLEPLTEAKEIELKLQTALRKEQVLCDMDRIVQVYSNLIGNALKFTPKGGTITLGAALIGHDILFSVTDTGPGIPQAHLPFIFDRFWQAARTARHGAGLGLAIVKGIVEAHDGAIWVDSIEGRGTCFSFRLRAVLDAAG